jgi:predicted homoserine dehydrogenase-like protein
VAVAKRKLGKGEMLDGEGGYTVWGKACPAERSVAMAALPIGLAHNVVLRRNVEKDAVLTKDDVELDETSLAVKIRREAERLVG